LASAAQPDNFDRSLNAGLFSQQPDLVLRLLEFLGLAYDAIFFRDLNAVITYWSARAEQLYGWPADEALGRVSHELLQTQFPSLPMPLDTLLLQAGRWEGELIHQRRDGARVVVESRQVLLRDAAGQPAAILETNRDITQRMRTEAARAELAAIVESSDDAILSMTLDAIITSWNHGAERLYGYTAQEVIGRSVALLIPPDHSDDLPSIMTRLRRGERIDHYETERITKDGRRLQVSLTVSPIRDAGGRIAGVSKVARDVTARKELEQALQVSHNQLETVLQSTADGILVQDGAGAIVFANDAAAHLCGFPSAAALRTAPIGEVVRNFVILDADGNPFPLEQLPAQQALLYGRTAEAIVRFRPRDGGDERWSMIRARPVLDGQGRVVLAVSAFQDITAFKMAELRERFLDQAGALLAQSLDYDATLGRVAELAVGPLADWAAVDLLDPDGTIRRVALAHRDPAKVALAHELERRYPTDPAATTGLPQVIRSGEAEFVPEIPQNLLDGAAVGDGARQLLEQLHLTSYLIVPLHARGSTLGAITFVYAESERHYSEADLTLAQDLADRAAMAVDNARLYRDALESVHVRDEFLASITHDLRTPLTTIRGSTQLAQRRLRRASETGNEPMLGILGNIEEAAGRMERMISALLDLARLQSGRPLDVDRQRMDLVSLVQELVEEHQRGAPGHQLCLDLAVPELTGFWDPVRLERVVGNLLSNAVKYSPPGSRIDVRVATEVDETTGATWARLDVADQGIGIPAADLPQIFDRFHRGSNVPQRTPGVGIGLAGAKQITELHQGTLTVESEVGIGTRFTVRLPVTSDESEEI
jgi:PAS domain S-box-containing protein